MQNLEEKEEWRNIEGYEGLYQVSNFGNVKSLGNGKSSNPNNSKERILKPIKHKNGYLVVTLYKEGKGKIFLIHRLVAQTFIPNPLNLPQVNHINEDKTDNRAKENLEWITHTDNQNYGTHNERSAKARSKAVKQYSLNGELIREFPSTIEVERRLGFDNAYIGKCCNGKYKTAYGYIWRYE